MRQLTPKESQCIATMISLYQLLGRMPMRYEIAAVLKVDPSRVSRLWTGLNQLGYLSMNPTEILRDEMGRRVRIETVVTVRRRGA